MSQQSFADRLKFLLASGGQKQNKAVSQAELAKKIGVTRQAISSYVNGVTSPPLDKFEAIADYFGVSYSYLLGKSDAQNDQNSDIVERLGLTEDTINVFEFLHEAHGLSPEEKEALHHTINMIISSFEFGDFSVASALFISKARDRDNGIPLIFEQEKETIQNFLANNGIQTLDDAEYLAFLFNRAKIAWQRVFEKTVSPIYEDACKAIIKPRPIDENGITQLVKKIREIESNSGEPDGDD